MSAYWFTPKTHGYGATPSNWKGWAALLLFTALIVGIAVTVMGWSSSPPAGPSLGLIAIWAVATSILIAAFVRFCRAKTDGQWAWRWGK